MKTLRYITLIAVSALLLACQKKEGIHTFLSTHSDGWASSDSLTFLLPPSQRDTHYDLQLELRLDRRYPYQDIWLVLNQTYETKPDRKHHSYTTIELKQRQAKAKHEPYVSHHQHYCDTLHLQLANRHRLNGIGKDLLVYRFPVRLVHLVRSEQGTVTVRHIMDCDTLPAIHDVGISFMPDK